MTDAELTELLEPVAEAIAKNCGSVPQLIFPHLFLGVKDLLPKLSQPAAQAEPVAVPAGWKLVLEEPTHAMLEAGYAGHADYEGQDEQLGVWRAMLAACPVPPSQPAAQVGSAPTDEHLMNFLAPWVIADDPRDRKDFLDALRAALKSWPAARSEPKRGFSTPWGEADDSGEPSEQAEPVAVGDEPDWDDVRHQAETATGLTVEQHTFSIIIREVRRWLARQAEPIDMVLHCPACGLQHIDAPDERTPGWKNEPHRSHLCHGCRHIWRPADVPTNGVAAVKTKGKADSPIAAQAEPSKDDDLLTIAYMAGAHDAKRAAQAEPVEDERGLALWQLIYGAIAHEPLPLKVGQIEAAAKRVEDMLMRRAAAQAEPVAEVWVRREYHEYENSAKEDREGYLVRTARILDRDWAEALSEGHHKLYAGPQSNPPAQAMADDARGS